MDWEFITKAEVLPVLLTAGRAEMGGSEELPCTPHNPMPPPNGAGGHGSYGNLGKRAIEYPSSCDGLISMFVQMHQPNEAVPLQQTAGLSIAGASEYQKTSRGKERLLVKHK